MSGEAVANLAKPHFGGYIFWPYQVLNENKSSEKDISRQQGMLNRTLGWEPGVLVSYSSSVSNKP